MLNKIKLFFSGVLAKVLLVVLIAAFAFVSFYDYGTGPGNTLATVNGKAVTLREVNELYNRFQQQRGNETQLSREESDYMRSQALQAAITQELYSQGLDALRFTASDTAVAEFITGNETFKTDGRFDRRKYDTFVTQSGYTQEQSESQIRMQLTAQAFERVAVNTSPGDTDLLAERVLMLSNMSYEARIAEFNADVVISPLPEPTDEEIKKYYDSHKPDYMTETGYDLSIVRYDGRDLYASIQVSQQELTDLYEKRKAELTRPESYKVSRIFFPESKRDSNIARSRYSYPFNFDRYIGKYSDDKEFGGGKGVLPILTLGQRPEYDEAVKKITGPGNFSQEVIKTKDGYSIIKLIQRNAEYVPQFDDVKGIIEESIKAEKASKQLKSFADKTRQEIFGGKQTLDKDFNQLFTEKGKTVVEQNNFTSTTQMTNQENARALYFVLKDKPEGHTGYYQFDDGAFIFYRVNKIHPSAERPLDEVKTGIKKELEQIALKAKAKELYEKYFNQVKDAQAFDAMVKELKIEKAVKKVNFNAAGPFISGIGSSQVLKDQVKQLGRDGIGRAVSTADGERLFIAVLDNIKPYTVDKEGAEFKQMAEYMRGQLTALRINDLQQKIADAQRRSGKIEYNDRALKQLNMSAAPTAPAQQAQ
ncbi:hypothetical protein CHS0354_018364 [Potamilus streckersoni]|uniref:Periplasmic chaperone PpiD n=1 Tax=Potamilus streckersoni TaxID=2493646 RepID=A0AAE0TAF1_9BIVA|nr:hypothetical protein CHS0354_018364 [Potamilus streckersoni]